MAGRVSRRACANVVRRGPRYRVRIASAMRWGRDRWGRLMGTAWGRDVGASGLIDIAYLLLLAEYRPCLTRAFARPIYQRKFSASMILLVC